MDNTIPKIRFKGFNDKWEKKTLGEICDVLTGGEAPKDHIKEFMPRNEYKYPIYSNGLNDNALWGYAKTYRINVICITFSSIGTLGYPEIREPFFTPIIRLKVLIPKNKNINVFYLKYNLLLADFNNNASGIPNINAEAVKAISIMYVKNPKEQEKIGNFFKNIDKLITTSEQKLEKLKNIKTSLLNKMFPQNNETTPKIRFKGFNDKWEKKTLGEIYDYERPDNYIVSSDKYSDQYNTPVLTANKAFILGYTNETKTYNKHSIIFDDFTLEAKYVDFPYMVKSSAIKILTIKNNNKDDLYFSFNLLATTKLEILGHARHYISVVQPTKTYTPQKPEQEKIGKFFKNTDKLISLTEKKIKKLKNIKNSLLNKMFI